MATEHSQGLSHPHHPYPDSIPSTTSLPSLSPTHPIHPQLQSQSTVPGLPSYQAPPAILSKAPTSLQALPNHLKPLTPMSYLPTPSPAEPDLTSPTHSWTHCLSAHTACFSPPFPRTAAALTDPPPSFHTMGSITELLLGILP